MARTTPQVDNGVLVDRVGMQLEAIEVGSVAWQRWLDATSTTTFRFVHALGNFTARKEQRHGSTSYWYAYRKQSGHLRKGYLGRAEELTLPRLTSVAIRLGNAAAARTVEQTAARAGEYSTLQSARAQRSGLVQDAMLATKLHAPAPRHDLVERPRLTERLNAGLRGPCVLVVAPAGFGKTTLLSEWHAAQGGRWPTAWLALDAGDNDLTRFLRCMVAAMQTLQADLGVSVLAGLRSPQPPVDVLLTSLLNDLAAQHDDLTLILDDYHLVTAPAIHRTMAFLLDHLPPRAHLLITARTDPPLPLSQLRARGRLAELGAADLRFTADETAAFLAHTMGLQLAADDVVTLATRTEGWIAGLQLAALALRGRDSAHQSVAVTALTGSHPYIFNYLADQVFDRQPQEVQRFLLHTSVLDRLNGPLCDALVCVTDPASSSSDGQALLERLDMASFFLVALDDTRTWYRYHQLFADFLRERLRRDDPDRVLELHRRASHSYARQGLLVDAVDHALAASDYADAAGLIEQVGTTLLWQRGEIVTLLRWLEHLPRDAARGRPRLCLDLAWALAWSDQADAVESRLQDAEQALAARAPATPAANGSPDAFSRALRGEIAALRVEIARQSGDIAAAISLARQALADLPADARQLRSITLGNLARAYLWSGNAVAASRTLAEAVALNQARDSIASALYASGRLVQAQALQGHLHQAAATYQHIRDLAITYGLLATPAIGMAKVGMAEVLCEWNELDAAEDLVHQGISECRASGGLAESALDGCLTLARILQARGDMDGALGQLQQAEAIGRESHAAQPIVRVAVALARLQLTATPGDLAAVVRWAGEREAAWNADEVPDLVGLLERLALARLRIVQGNRHQAAVQLALLLPIAEVGGLTGFVLEILVLQARILLEDAQEAQAMITLSRALALAEPETYVRLFIDEGMAVVPLLRLARARGVAPVYVGALLTACGNAPQAAFPHGVARVEPLSARELALLRLVAAGLSTPEVAARLYVTAGTVRTHLKNIGTKLDVHSRLQAVERARALGLL